MYTLKTALQFDHTLFMLGTFDLIDELMIGSVTSKTITADTRAVLPALHNTSTHSVLPIPVSWFQHAFSQLPLGKVTQLGFVKFF